MNKVCSLWIQRVYSFSESREKSKRSLTARLCWLAVPQPSITYWRVQNSFQTTVPCSHTCYSCWEQGLSVSPLLPTHWQVAFRAVCLIHKYLYRAGQRFLSETPGQLSTVQVVVCFTSSSPRSYCREQGEEEENDLKEKRKELKEGWDQRNCKDRKRMKLLLLVVLVLLLILVN